MKYLWLGVGILDAEREDVLRRGGRILSSAVSNDAIVRGLAAHGVKMDSVNAYRFPAYPRYRRLKTARCAEVTPEASHISVSYWNLPFYNLISRKKAICKEVRRWLRERSPDEDVCVFVYSMHSPFLAAARMVKRRLPGAKIVLIVPDLPQYMDVKKSRLKSLLKRIDWLSIKKCLRSVDQYVLYSRHMADFLKLRDGTWTVMEGSYDASLTVSEADIQREPDRISVMYSGRLDLCYGIKELLGAMELLDQNYELWLTGDGNALPLIREAAERDARIRYYGFLPSRYELLKKQCEATMLISTRNPDEPASAYCFPSKIFEYMASANPVISTRIRGIPDAYFEHLIPLSGITPREIADAIRRVAEMPADARAAFGRSAREFVLTQKNNIAQARKILDFI